ncbi:hypothetical protein O181_124805 [Austropuccinia psidii MF-1]|uniref:Integrase catalytic domain-containing protein n=1 Tax=Austropuccinia psidii MF-1 TaxID=1389203 RepID=A0A9Q3KNK6_9BASI|nr:hypothetical protein [Austropuccinia psidii MF-1]
MIKIQEPRIPWEIFHMHCVTDLPPGDDRSYNACLVIVDRFSKNQIFLPCHKDDTAMDIALLIWNRVISWTGIFTNIISDKDPKFNSALLKNLHQLFEAKLSFFTGYNLQLMDWLTEKSKPLKIWSEFSACDSRPEHKDDSQNTINQWYSQDTTKTWS